MRYAYRCLGGKPEGKTSLGRVRSKWKNIMKIDISEIVFWICPAFTWLTTGTIGGPL
jgi:hypothetical protein